MWPLSMALSQVVALAGPSAMALVQEVSPPERSYLTLPERSERGASALVREIRNVRLVEGRNFVRVYDFSPRMDASTVMLRSLTAPAHLDLVEQSLWFEVLDRKRLLELLVGQEVSLHLELQHGSEDFSGRLLLAPTAPGPHGERAVPTYVATPEGTVRPIGDAELRIPNLPEGDWNRPRLDWVLSARNAGRDRVEMSYRTEGLSYVARYLVRIADDGTRADLRCLATLHNETGKDFQEAEVQLRAPVGVLRAHQNIEDARAAASDLYPIDHPVRIERRRLLQVQIASATDLPVVTYAALRTEENLRDGQIVPVRLCFDLGNTTVRGLGLALPPGSLEVRRLDDQGRMFASTGAALPASVPGELLTVPTEAIPGVYATIRRTSPQTGRTVQLVFVNERSDSVEVTVIEPLAVRERITSSASIVDLSRRGWGRIRVEVPSASSLQFEYRVERDG